MCAVHSSPEDLTQYLVFDGNKEIRELNWGPNENGIEELLMTALQGIITSALALVSFFKAREIDALNEYQARLNELTKRIIEDRNDI